MEFGYLITLSTSLITLTILEIVLGIDNLVFISILCGRLPSHQQKLARQIGLMLALVARLLLLASIVWIIRLTNPLFQIMSYSFSFRDLFMIGGGLFLITKGTWEIHNEIEEVSLGETSRRHASFLSVIVQIVIFDLIFSLDSILTAIGLTTQVWIMAIAIIIAICIMLWASEPVSRFIHRHASIKMLALSFLLLIGMVLIADGFHMEIPKGYIYFSIFFSLVVEALNIAKSKKHAKGKIPTDS